MENVPWIVGHLFRPVNLVDLDFPTTLILIPPESKANNLFIGGRYAPVTYTNH